MKPLTVIIEAGLMLLVILTPYAFGSVPLWAYTFIELAVLGLLFVRVIQMIKEGELGFPKSPLNIPILLFLILVIFQLIPLPQTLLSIISPATGRFYADTYSAIGSTADLPGVSSTITLNAYATGGELLRMLAYLGAFFLIIGNISTSRDVKRLIIVIVIAGFVLALFALIQYFSWNGKVFWTFDYSRSSAPFGPFRNKNNYAGYINMIIPLAFALSLYAKDKGVKFLFLFMALLMTISVMLSMSRGGLVSFLVAALFMAGMLFFLKRGRGYGTFLLVGGAFFIVLIFYLAFIGIDPLVDRFSTLVVGETYNKNMRWTVWASTIEMIKDYPLFGTGFGTFETVFPVYRPVDIAQLHWRDAHNDYLQLLSDVGIAGFAIVISFFVIFFRSLFKAFIHGSDEGKSILIVGLSGSVVAFLCSIVFTFNTHIPASALLFAVILALTVSISKSGRQR